MYLQLAVLICGQSKKDVAASVRDRQIKGLPDFQVRQAATSVR
jgi:hypothetical protein